MRSGRPREIEIDARKVREYAALGFSLDAMAAALEVNPATMRRYRYRDPAIKAAFEEGAAIQASQEDLRPRVLKALQDGYSIPAIAVLTRLKVYAVRVIIRGDPDLAAELEARGAKPQKTRVDAYLDIRRREAGLEPRPGSFDHQDPIEAQEAAQDRPVRLTPRINATQVVEAVQALPLSPRERAIRERVSLLISPGSQILFAVINGIDSLAGLMRVTGLERADLQKSIRFLERASKVEIEGSRISPGRNARAMAQ